jgi:hypothetical protein
MRVEDDQYPAQGRSGSTEAPQQAADGTPAHPEWAPPEYYPTGGEHGEHRTDAGTEPPGPVPVSDNEAERAVADVDAGEFPPDDYASQQATAVVPPGGPDGHTYGAPATDDAVRREPVDEAGTDEPAVGVASVPTEAAPEPAEPDQAVDAATAPAEEARAEEARAEEPEPDEEARAEEPEPAPVLPEEPQAEEPQAEEPQAEEARAEEAAQAEEAEAEAAAPEELSPGEVPTEPATAFWQLEILDGYRDRWQLIQLHFIDDPRAAAEQAQALVTDVIQGLTAAVTGQRDELDRWRDAELDDTEELRMTVRRYRDLLDRLYAL